LDYDFGDDSGESENQTFEVTHIRNIRPRNENDDPEQKTPFDLLCEIAEYYYSTDCEPEVASTPKINGDE